MTTTVTAAVFSPASFAQVNIVSSDLNGLSLAYRPGKATIDTMIVDNTACYNFHFDGHIPRITPGAPALPVKSVYFAAPAGSAPVVSLGSLSETVLSGIEIAPFPRIETDDAGMSLEIFEQDPSFYALSGYRPKNHVEHGEQVSYDGITVHELVLSPIIYDAYGKTAAIIDSCTISISFPGNIDTADLSVPMPDYICNYDIFQGIRSPKAATSQEDPFASGEWYKITFRKSGMYSMTGSELSKAGFPTGSVQVEDIRLYYNGGWLIDSDEFDYSGGDFREIAIQVNDTAGDGIFNSNDSIVFYGESITRFYTKSNRDKLYYQNHAFTEDNVVWLTTAKDGTPLRIQNTGVTPSSGLDAVTTYRCNRHVENDYQLELITGGKEWFWEAIFDKNRQFTISTPGALTGTSSLFRVGLLNQYLPKSHQVYVYINDEKPVMYYFSERKGYITHEYQGDLRSGNNDFKIVRKYNPGESNVSVRLDWVEVEYERTLSFDENHLEFFYLGDGSPVKFTASNVHSSAVKVFDTTDPYNVAVFNNAQYDPSGHTLSFQKTLYPDSPTRFIFTDSSSYLKVSSVARKNQSNARSIPSGANYIIITNSLFLEEARKLAEWRSRDSQSDPLVTMVVNIDDIIDDYNRGIYDPMAIRNFLKTVRDTGGTGKTYYCCIIGDSIYKYKNLTEAQAGRNFVPSYSDYDGTKLALTNDDFFCWFDRNRIPAFAMGRLCATDKETARILVDKTIDYEKNPEYGPWHNRVLLIGDDELTVNGVGQEIVHTIQTESLDDPALIPSNLERRKIMLVEYPLKNLRKPDVTEAIIEAINDGYLLTNYFGHGNDDLLSHEHVLVGTRDIERFTNEGRLPMFTVFSCSVGKFTQLDNISLAEILHLKKGGGAIGVIAGTELTFSNPNLELSQRYMVNLFDSEKNPENRIGCALYNAKRDLPGKSNPTFYMLFGDPATRLSVPRYSFSVAEVDTIYRLQKLDLSGAVTNSGEPIQYEGTLHITARGPKIHKTYTTNNNVYTINYTQPGRVFFKGEQHISGNGFNAAVIVPKDLTSGGNESSIYLFADGQNIEASDAVRDFVIGGLDPNAPDDRSGPEISLFFDSVPFDDGDYISRQPAMKASIRDQSGVNIYGNRGHNITLLLDNKEIIVLTDNYKAVNGYSTGMVEYQLPILSPGEHSLEMKVYDTYNNVSKLSVTANVVGSETGDVTIMNLLNYPNPMGNDGTTFTFNLTDDTRRADIKIYSQSGRLVDTLRFSAGYGFNKVYWKPPFSIANGVYFYKLSVRSVNGRKSSKIEKLVMMK